MRIWHLFLVRRGWRFPDTVRAYAAWESLPDRWRRRSKYLGTLAAGSRCEAERAAWAMGWKRNHGRLVADSGLELTI